MKLKFKEACLSPQWILTIFSSSADTAKLADWLTYLILVYTVGSSRCSCVPFSLTQTSALGVLGFSET